MQLTAVRVSHLAIAALLIASAGQAVAQSATPARKPSKAARDFSLDLGTAPGDARATAPAEAPTTLFSLDTPIERLLADPRARAVLDRNLPGLSTDENLPKFRALSLRRFQPLTGGQLSNELLQRTGVELAAIPPVPVGKGRNTGR